ncbi:phosphoribosyl-AMP cyclohydrolase [Tateyamaria omphalii]|uniref:Phosphoribosyl-AMP cyclohydrolase n=1 Tax=Tateyamaria omphalii TaxID=299262 RepID=A0A1P8MT02_9RHOB|nr:phosphoribosyl-AMP cyclohydrolase [Tateyamaria omphalii]APX11227.1 phosphoribosyl-AMP cyclohydrolase [Tateyamaria omphalii]
MLKTLTLTSALAIAATAGLAGSADKTALTPEKVTAFKTAWGEGIVNIGQIHTDGGDYEAAARTHIETFYAYGQEDVLFKPTLASEDQFRGTFDEALSYFVGGSIEEDGGFAIAPYTDVRWENEGTLISGDTAMAMGNYFFTTTDGSEIKVEYSFGLQQMDDGDLKIVLHHSSIPFVPADPADA